MSPIIVLVIQYLAIAILFLELIYAICQKPSEMQMYVIVLTTSTILMFIGYTIELNATNLSEALAGTGISYLGKPFVMVSSFLFICSFYGKTIKPVLIEGLSLWAFLFPVIVFTNKYHYLYYSTVAFDSSLPYSPLVLTHGPYYYLYIATSIIYLVACVAVILQGYKKSKRKSRGKLAIFSILMVVSGIAGYAVFLSGITGSYDSTMLGVFFSVVFLFLIFARCRIFDPLNLAKDSALEDSSVGLLVFDDLGSVVYKNATVDKMLQIIPKTLITDMKKDVLQYRTGGKTYKIMRKNLLMEGNVLGKSIEITDVTDTYNYRVKLEENIRERTAHIETIQRQVVSSLANIVEARSVENQGVVSKTGDYAYLIARKMRSLGFYENELTEDFINTLRDAAPLRDIGKISVPDRILLKTSNLTADEFAAMSAHTSSGAQIIDDTMYGLESDYYISVAKEIARYHHERWDGKGYPEGLKEESIPLSARIVAVADTFEDLYSAQSGDPSVDKRQFIKTIQDASGSSFDPKIVTAFALAMAEV